jgi:hypothetical protein
MSLTTIQIDNDLLEKVKKIAQNKWPLRKITKYAEATREVFFDFVKRNKKFLNKQEKSQTVAQNQKEPIQI